MHVILQEIQKSLAKRREILNLWASRSRPLLQSSTAKKEHNKDFDELQAAYFDETPGVDRAVDLLIAALEIACEGDLTKMDECIERADRAKPLCESDEIIIEIVEQREAEARGDVPGQTNIFSRKRNRRRAI